MKKIYRDVDIKNIIDKSPLKGIWKTLSGFHGLYFCAVLSMAIAALCKTFSFILLRFFVDDVLTAGLFSNLLYLFALGFVGLAAVEGLASFLRGKLAARSSEGVTLRLRNQLFDHIQHVSFTYHDHTQTGELIERVTSDVDRLRRFYGEQATEIGSILALFVFNFMAILNLNLLLGLLSLVFLPVILLISTILFKKIFKAYDRYQDQEARLSTILQENVSAIQVVRAFARKEYEMDKFEKENLEKYNQGRKLLMLHAFFWPVTDILCVAQTLLIAFTGGFMAIQGNISPGTFIAITGLVANIVWPMRNIGRIVIDASTAFVSYKRIMEILSEKVEPAASAKVANRPASDFSIKGDIHFEHVSFQYKNTAAVLQDISFKCRHGEIIALLGATGSGKTTLINLLPRFYNPSGGRIYIDGKPIEEYPVAALRSQIGIIEQEPFLFSTTIRENIIYGSRKAVTDEDVQAAAMAAAIHDVIMEFPEGYATRVGEKGITLSGGQKQRLAIARTLLKDPRILIMDDATSSIDAVTEARIRQGLTNLMRNRTCFIIAHRVQTVMNADRILILENGRLVQQGTHHSLLKTGGFYRKIFQDQFVMKKTNSTGGIYV